MNNFEKLKGIFDCIGLEYDDTTFINNDKTFKHNDVTYIDNYDKKYDNEYRAWQINQPIKNMNSEIDIPDEMNERLLKSEFIKKLGYTN